MMKLLFILSFISQINIAQAQNDCREILGDLNRAEAPTLPPKYDRLPQFDMSILKTKGGAEILRIKSSIETIVKELSGIEKKLSLAPASPIPPRPTTTHEEPDINDDIGFFGSLRKLFTDSLYPRRDFENLSEEKRAALMVKKSDLETKLKHLQSLLADKELEERQNDSFRRQQARAELHRAMAHPLVNSAVRDLFGYYTLNIIPKTNKVTLLIGEREGATILQNPEQVEELETFVKKLRLRNYVIVFEGYSAVAPIISSAAADRGVAVFDSHSEVTESPLGSKNSISISNDYLRMKAFAESKSVIITTDSLTGIGLAIEGGVTNVWNINDYTNRVLEDWKYQLRTKGRDNLGINIHPLEKSLSLLSLLKRDGSWSQSYQSPLSELSEKSPIIIFQVDNLALGSFETVVNGAFSYAQVMYTNQNTGGAVVFGSSRHDSKSAALIYESSFALGTLGYAIATGGAGGAMQLANAGGYNSGTLSIGIPITGKSSLVSEKTIARSDQTLTIDTGDYSERIPALLGEGSDARKLIIFAPGGGGTMKELAVTLVRLSKFDHGIEQIIFLDSQYYNGLEAWLKSLPLPASFKDKLFVTDSREEMTILGQMFIGDLELAHQALPRQAIPDYTDVRSRFEYTPPPTPPKPKKPGRNSSTLEDYYSDMYDSYGYGYSRDEGDTDKDSPSSEPEPKKSDKKKKP